MKRMLFRLAVRFGVFVLFTAALSVMGFAALSRIPAEGDALGGLRAPLLVAFAIVPLFAVGLAYVAVKSVGRQLLLYEKILDAIPTPITVTDLNMNWLFVNKRVCDMLGREREEFRGKHCSDWGAAICGTENCGVARLRRGESATTFSQFGGEFHVDVCYLTDEGGRNVGHIEMVRDITTEATLKKQQEEAIGRLSIVSDSFAAASQQIAAGSQSLAQGASEQAASIEELSGSVTEISGMAKDSTRLTAEATGEVRRTGELMALCMTQMERMLASMGEISEKSQNIQKTAKAIDDIAFQTNILALNAAVEAARAGGSGRGFSVVAEEVRNLASKSAEAAKSAAEMIESSARSVTEGNRIVGEVSESLEAAVALAEKNAERITAVNTVSCRQSEAMEQITANIGHIANIVQENSAAAEELASTSAEMNGQTNQIHRMIETLDGGGDRGRPSPEQTLPARRPDGMSMKERHSA